eukprot:CAMPEP_0168365290 /NCGR_PEP_ID=MMETSP0228-20121227/4643_1 /TAXON_ID=133427 /ORGANISM="Protoceratium reticulatum, Strain CCCM 535 (=CCMP 1889)" /LENGTH=439 /DNA_ID=CAMNT_0008378069 /DNA_START=196 /DNA_END=1515 /DNA_ORIENTATION=-
MAPYVVSYMRHQGFDVDYAQMSWTVSVTTSLQAIAMCASGKLHDRWGIRTTARLGSCILTTGILLSSWTVRHGKFAFLVTYSGLFGLGMGIAYMAPMLCLMRWLPGMKGLASGLVVAAFGAGTCIWNLAQEHWINPTHMEPTIEHDGNKYFDWENPDIINGVLVHVPSVLRREAVIFFILQFCGIMMLRDPPEPPPQDAEAPAPTKEIERSPSFHPCGRDMGPSEMVRTTTFWILMANVFCNAQVILIMAASQKTFGLELLPQVAESSLTNMMGGAALMNGLGRVAWGLLADWTSFRGAMVTLCGMLAILVVTLPTCRTGLGYCMWICGIFFGIGGNFALFPLATSTFFGPTHMGTNYGVVFIGLAASELVGSMMQQFVLDGHGISTACQCMALMSVLGCLAASQLEVPVSRDMPGLQAILATEKHVTYGTAFETTKAD